MLFSRLVLLLAFVAAGCSRPTAVPAKLGPLSSGKPRVLVLLVFDQFRGDYLSRWADLYGTDGFQRLMKDGTWFTECHYPYSCTITGCGHASLLTGCSPDRHGIIENEWFERNEGKMVYCATSDFRELVYSIPKPTPDPRDSAPRKGGTPERLLAESVGDVLKAANGKTKVVAVSLKDRSACLPGGKNADEAYWFDSRTGTFVTSTYYRDKMPNWVASFNSSKPADKWIRTYWNRLRSDVDYTSRSGPDDVIGETAGISKKMERVFPHPISINKATPDREYYNEVTCSPFGNELLLSFAKTAFDATEVGRGETTDLFSLSFSSNDILGHSFGPDSHEVLDMTLRTDRIVAEWLTFLDSRMGQGNYVLAFTSDHGICPIPEVSNSKGIDAVRLDPRDLRKAGEDFLNSKYGFKIEESSHWIEGDAFPWVYLNHRKIEGRGLIVSSVAQEVVNWIRQQPWAMRAFTRFDLEHPKPDDDEITRRVRKAFHRGRAGDLGFVLKPYYISQEYPTGTTHGSPHPYDTHVPLIFFGPGIKAQQSTEPVSPQSVAAVFTHVAGARPPAQIDAPVPKAIAGETGK